MIDYAHKSKARTARKRCTKCGATGYYRPRERNCKIQQFGPQSYCCWGPLVDDPIVRRRRTAPPAHDATRARTAAPVSDMQRGVAHREKAARKLDAVRRRITTTLDSMARLRRLLDKQRRDERKWAKEAAVDDATLSARRERARHAARVGAQVQRVRRRLTHAIGTRDETSLALLRARQRVHRVVQRRQQTRVATRRQHSTP